MTETALHELGDEMEFNIYKKYGNAINSASVEAPNIIAKWGSPVNRLDRAAGGYHFSTYKAIVRRNGAYVNALGPHDWNLALVSPMMKHIAGGWERVFSRRTAAVIARLTRNSLNLLKVFHPDVATRANLAGLGVAGISLMEGQVRAFAYQFKELSQQMKQKLDEGQRNINREFTPVIINAITPAYQDYTEERGIGSYKRMKSIMENHIAYQKEVMFEQSCKSVQAKLRKLISSVAEAIENS